MSKDINFDKNEFISVFSGFFFEENNEMPNHEILYSVKQFFISSFNDVPKNGISYEFQEALKEIGEEANKVSMPLIRAIIWIISEIFSVKSEISAKEYALPKLFSFVEALIQPSQKSIKSEESELRSIFNFIANSDTPAKLLNSYKGLRVFRSAEIIKICDEERVFLRVHPEQIKALALENYTCIIHKFLPQQITADVKYIDTVSNTVELVNLVILKKPFDRRKIHRLQPEQPIAAVVFSEGEKTDVEIVDVSLRGVSLRLKENIIPTEAEIRINFMLPIEGGEQMHLRGKLKYVFCEEVCKMGVETFPDHSQEAIIKKYLLKRMKDIEQELG